MSTSFVSQYGGSYTRYGKIYLRRGGSIQEALNARLLLVPCEAGGLRFCADTALLLSLLCTCLVPEFGVMAKVCVCWGR